MPHCHPLTMEKECGDHLSPSYFIGPEASVRPRWWRASPRFSVTEHEVQICPLWNCCFLWPGLASDTTFTSKRTRPWETWITYFSHWVLILSLSAAHPFFFPSSSHICVYLAFTCGCSSKLTRERGALVKWVTCGESLTWLAVGVEGYVISSTGLQKLGPYCSDAVRSEEAFISALRIGLNL